MAFPHFSNPQYIYLGLPVAVILVTAFWYWSVRARQAMRKRYGEAHLVDSYSSQESMFSQYIGLTAWLVAIGSLIVAASGPYISDSPEQVRAGTTQVVVVLDVSISMAAEDYRKLMPDPVKKSADDPAPEKTEVVGPYGSRLDVAKILIDQVLRSISGNQVGLVNYAGKGFPQSDLTTDYTALSFVVKNWVKIGNAPDNGSNFGEGIIEAVKTFKRDEDLGKNRCVVLISDGGLTGDKARVDEAVKQLQENNINLIVVGVGLYEPTPIPVYDFNKEFVGYFGDKGQPVMTTFDEATLEGLASQCNGKYIHLDSGYEKLELPWVGLFGGQKVEPNAVHIYYWFVAASMLVLFGIALSQFFHKRNAFSHTLFDQLNNGQSTSKTTERTQS